MTFTFQRLGHVTVGGHTTHTLRVDFASGPPEDVISIAAPIDVSDDDLAALLSHWYSPQSSVGGGAHDGGTINEETAHGAPDSG
jgi:hypothetical protein